jgi:hypothetical protein
MSFDPILLHFDHVTLQSGKHHAAKDGHCLLEVVSMFAGEPFSDAPACVCPVLAEFGRNWNDALRNDEERRALLQYIPRLVDTVATPKIELARAFMAVDWMARAHLPAVLERFQPLIDQAATLRDLPEVNSNAAALRAGVSIRLINRECLRFGDEPGNRSPLSMLCFASQATDAVILACTEPLVSKVTMGAVSAVRHATGSWATATGSDPVVHALFDRMIKAGA